MDQQRIDITTIPAERRKRILERNPDTKTITIGPEEYTFFFGGATFSIAKMQGIDLSEVLEATTGSVEDNVDQFCYLLYCGIVPFEPDISPEEIKLMLSFEEMRRLQKVIMPDISDAVQEGADSASGSAGGNGSAVGNAPAAPSPSMNSGASATG